MKRWKMMRAAGVTALGMVSSLRGANTGDYDAHSAARPLSASAQLRMFYDDNFLSLPDATRIGTPGVEISPTISYKHTSAQFFFQGSYTFLGRFYTDIPATLQSGAQSVNLDSLSMEHDIDLKADYRVNPQFRLRAWESFSSRRDPDFSLYFSQFGGDGNPLPTTQNYYHNVAGVTANYLLSALTGLEASYYNSFYDYPEANFKSLSRMENSAYLEAKWQANTRLIPRLGYKYFGYDYTGGSAYSVNNSVNHTPYIGVDYILNAKSSISLSSGVTFSEYPNSPNASGTLGPYAQALVNWSFATYTRLSLSLSHSRAPAALGSGGRDAESTSANVNVIHNFTQRFSATASCAVTFSSLSGGSGSGIGNSSYISPGLSLNYQFQQHVSTELGYRHDQYTTTVPGAYDWTRNYTYAAVIASF